MSLEDKAFCARLHLAVDNLPGGGSAGVGRRQKLKNAPAIRGGRYPELNDHRLQAGKCAACVLWWGGPPGPRGTPPSRLLGQRIKSFQNPAGRPRTRASAPLFFARRLESTELYGIDR